MADSGAPDALGAARGDAVVDVIGAVVVLTLAACRPPDDVPEDVPTATVTGQAMGGDVRIVVRCPVEQHAACMDEAVRARTEIERLGALATDWEPGGEIAALNAAAGDHPVPISADVRAMLDVSGRVWTATRGAFDPTIGALWGLWDFDAGKIPSDEALAAKLPLVGWDKVVLQDGTAFLPEEGMAVTLGGVAQGVAAARALQAIDHDAAVDVSGDVAVRGAWPIVVQHPRKPRGEGIASLVLRDAVLTTSGDYEHSFDVGGVRYHHVLDPKTGQPGRGAISATVVSSDGGVADALATALLILGPDEAAVKALDAWALVVTPDLRVHVLGDAHGHVTGLRSH